MDYDVIVVGGGNAAFAAAVSARDHGAKRVLLLEKAPREKRGGNTHFSGAIFRFTYNDVSELDRFVPDAERDYPGFHAGVQPYPVDVFRDDLMRVTQGRSDPELATLLIENSYDTVCWLQDVGRHKFELALSVMGVRVGKEVKWPRGAMIRTVHEGVGLSKTWFETGEKMGIEIRYETGAQRLTQGESARVSGVVARGPDGFVTLEAKAVVLACGGFETNPEWRLRFPRAPRGPAQGRGAPFNK